MAHLTFTFFGFLSGIIGCVSIQSESGLANRELLVRLPLLCLLLVVPNIAAAQQGAATGEPLVIQTTSLPKAYLRQNYETHLEAQGGITPLRWEVTEGKLPEGILLARDGILTGVPTETGDFQFTVTLTDSGRPAAQRNQQLVLTV